MLQYVLNIFRTTWQLFALFFLVIGIALGYMVVKHRMASTSEARVVTNVIPIGAPTSGVVSKIYIKDNQFVRQGQDLFELSSDDLHLQYTETEARLNVLQQTLNTLKRQLPQKYTANEQQLIKDKIAQKQAEMKEAQTALHSLEQKIAQLLIKAPTAGYISNFNLHEGTVVPSYHALFGIIQPAPVWVIANFLETDLVRIRPGQEARVHITMYPGVEYEGEVESIGYGITPSDSPLSEILPTISPNTSWNRLSQRFPVRIRLHNPDPNIPMRVGANARVKILLSKH